MVIQGVPELVNQNLVTNSKRPLKAAELLDELENLVDGAQMSDGIVLLPCDEGEDSVEDSGDEECNDPDRLCSVQLNAEAEFYYENDNDINEGEVEPHSPLAQTEKRAS
ncbi:hypothetical protein NQ315_013459 [Exocentrus adspersus]|uniref:Uncharacterized protein n=1 Tax=Exocentrus adspersus TaxID=1586481 RepID=A0AAV8VE28_9CUCU|nr:hypothetical protein NQ315_013459 [Exocentrus adspersus]